jgi:hypothetical protein
MSMKLRSLAVALLAATMALPNAPVSAATFSTNTAIKGESNSAVYWYATDGKRYVFPTEGTYYSWFPDFNNVRTITDSELASITIGGNVTYRPGSKMIKITTDPRTYAVSKGGYLRLITSESMAISLYGSEWAKQVHDLPDAFFVNYKMGNTIYSLNDFSVSSEYHGVVTPSDSIFNTTTPNTPNTGAMSVTLAASRSFINEGESVALSGRLFNAPSYGYRLDIIDYRNGNVIRTCYDLTYCDTTVNPYRNSTGANNVQYFIALKRTSDNYEVTREYSPVIYFNGSANGLFTSGSSKLEVNKTSINNGDSITLTATASNINVADNQLRMEFYRETDNALVYTCYDSRVCTYTHQVFAQNSTNSIRYYVIVKNDNNEQIPAAYSSRISISGSTGTYGLNASVNKTSIVSGDTVNFTAQVTNTPSSNYRIEIYNQNGSLRTTCYNTAYCYLTEAVTNNGSQSSAIYTVSLKDANNTLLTSTPFAPISFSGTNNNYALTTSVNKTSIMSGETVTFTAQFTNAPSSSYRIEIYDQNNSLRTTCNNTAYCYLTEAVTKSGSQEFAQYKAYAKENNVSEYVNLLASKTFPNISFGVTANPIVLTGTASLTISPSGTRPAGGTVTMTATASNTNVASDKLTVRIWAGVTPVLVKTCTNTSTCTANYNVGAAGQSIPVYTSVTADNGSNSLLSTTSWIYTN